LDTEFTYSKLAIAALYINEQKCKLIATNDDAFVNVNGRRYPSCGSILASLKESLVDKSCLEIVGKPNSFGIDCIIQDH
jgi:ribonucleotide monophosphatase NagD (HAD superfamily)